MVQSSFVRTLVLALLLGAILVPAAESQTRTTAPSVFVNVHVTLTDSKVIVSPKTAPRGSDARFIIRNIGTKPHSFTLITGAQHGFSRVFKPGKHATTLLLYLNYRGALTYYGGDSSAQAGPAMRGTFLVGPTCTQCVQDD